MRILSDFVFKNFSFFLFFLSFFLLQNQVLIFKLANNLNVNKIEEQAFNNYINKKPIDFSGKKIEKIENKNELLSGVKPSANVSVLVFDEKVFYKKLEKYKKLLEWIYRMLGFSILFLVYKFIKKVRF